MLKKRLIFTLLIQDGVFQLSRNFSLQSVGDLGWLYKHYHFNSIARSIDELVLLNVKRGEKVMDEFTPLVQAISENCFMPIAAGGGIKSLSDAYQILDAGADKMIVNTALFLQPELVKEMVKTFGGQSIVASIDYKRTNLGNEVFINNGAQSTGMALEQAVSSISELGIGEIYLTSIDRDGTGQGYDIEAISKIASLCQLPIIASGGVGDFEHFVDGMKIERITGASTANIFNFIQEGLTEARSHVQQQGVKLANWDFSSLN